MKAFLPDLYRGPSKLKKSKRRCSKSLSVIWLMAMRAPVIPGGVLDLIGNTPLVRIRKINPNPNVELWAKLESANPGGSVKDRVALAMIEEAEKSGKLTKDKIILEATSGNTGIGLALVGTVKGYRVLLAMSEAVSEERRKILAAFGAEFLLTPAHLGTDGAIEVVYRMQRREPDRYFIPDQYNNPANPLAHYRGTAAEIIEQTCGRITHFVAAMGTTGTLMGCSMRLKEFNPEIRIIGVEPYLGHKIQGLKNLKEAYRPGIFDRSRLDEKVPIADEDAFETARLLAREEGLLVGMSSGAAMYVALQKAKELKSGVIVVLLPDGGERYLSTTLFAFSPPAGPKRECRLQIYDTAARARVPFKPLVPGIATIYTCGPTVHAEPTLGLLRRVVVTDVLRRYLEYCGLEVRHVMNITDLDDRTIRESERLGIPLKELTRRYEEEFMRCLDLLSVKRAWKYPRASEHVEDMIAFTRRLIEKGYAYERLRSVYFDIGKYEHYGRLSGLDTSKIKIGATVDLDEYEKDDPRDFTLFKRATLAEMAKDIFFETEWGNVRPGWHIQCATMSTKYLGEQFDIHTSGVDLLFPHSENEVAICHSMFGKEPARYWMHVELVTVQGRKMSRSAGNALTLSDLIAEGWSGRDVRLLMLQTHYRQPLSISHEKLRAARAAARRLDAFVWHLLRSDGPGKGSLVEEAIKRMRSEFESAMDADLNAPAALGAVFSMIRDLNPHLLRNELSEGEARSLLSALEEVDKVLAVIDLKASAMNPQVPEVIEIIRQREEARKARNFSEADRLRDELARQGYVVEDTVHGPLYWKEAKPEA